MTNPPNNPGGYNDPYGQPNQTPYGQPAQDPYGQPAQDPYGQQSSYGQPSAPQSAAPYGQPQSATPYGQPGGATPYGQDSNSYGASQPPASQYAETPYQSQGAAMGTAPVQPYGAMGAAPARPSMGFVQAWKAFFKNYVNFYGRAGKGEFWWPAICIILLDLIYSGISMGGALASISNASADPTAATNALAGTGMFSMLLGLIMLAVALPYLACLVRRLHDTGRSGWYYFMFLIPLAGPFILLAFLLGDSKPEGARFDNPDGSQPSLG